MRLSSLSPRQAAQFLAQGAILIDIRSAAEYTRKHIEGAQSLPIGQLSHQQLPADAVVIFSCLSGMRTRQNARKLQDCSGHCTQAYLLEGGINAWQKAGLPVHTQASASLDIMRQVQLAAGFLVLLGVLLGTTASPWFYGLSAFVGAGLMFAGLTGFCGMAKLLAIMPWNRF